MRRSARPAGSACRNLCQMITKTWVSLFWDNFSYSDPVLAPDLPDPVDAGRCWVSPHSFLVSDAVSVSSCPHLWPAFLLVPVTCNHPFLVLEVVEAKPTKLVTLCCEWGLMCSIGLMCRLSVIKIVYARCHVLLPYHPARGPASQILTAGATIQVE